MIIAGHNCRSHFSRLKTLDIGSKIWFIDLEGNRFEYKVSDIEIIKGTDVKQMEKGKWDMTLFTCTYGGQNRMALRCTITNMLAGGN
ncbi:MAG: sortase [Anaerostipes hadrus]